MTRHALLSALLLSAPALAQGQVHVIDANAGPGTDFTSLIDGWSSAADGDVLLVRTGNYDHILIDGKSLAVVADAGATVTTGAVTVRNLASGQWALVQGLDIFGANNVRAVAAHDNGGTVWIEDCTIAGSFPFGFPSGGVAATDSASLVLARCQVSEPGGSPPFAEAVLSERSNLHLVETTVLGFDGATTEFQGGTGTSAVRVVDGSFSALGAVLEGGDGGDGLDFHGLCGSGGNGGDGLELAGAGAPAAFLFDVVASAGLGGSAAGAGTCTNGLDGSALDVQSGSVTSSAAPAGLFQVASPVRAGSPVNESYEGAPGTFVWLVWSGSAAVPTGPVAGFGGPPVHLASVNPIFRGVLDGAGQLTTSFTVAAVPPGLEALQLPLQALFVEFGPLRLTAGAPAALVVLDPTL